MKRLVGARASAILYDVLRSTANLRTFLLPANICPIVPITFIKAGAPFEFVDLDPNDLKMDMNAVEERLDSGIDRYGGILYAHTYGNPSTPLDSFRRIKARSDNFVVIDDRCLCSPELDYMPDETVDCTLFSTGYGKIVDIGLGGFALIQDKVPHQHRSLPFDPACLRTVEAEFKACVEMSTWYQDAGLAWLQTEADLPSWPELANHVRISLNDTLSHRRTINAVYNSLIPVEMQLAAEFQLWRFNLRVADKGRVLQSIFEAGLFASSHYASLVGILGEGADKNARELSAHVVNLFNDHHYNVDMAERTARIVLRSL